MNDQFGCIILTFVPQKWDHTKGMQSNELQVQPWQLARFATASKLKTSRANQWHIKTERFVVYKNMFSLLLIEIFQEVLKPKTLIFHANSKKMLNSKQLNSYQIIGTVQLNISIQYVILYYFQLKLIQNYVFREKIIQSRNLQHFLAFNIFKKWEDFLSIPFST
eukprot:EC097407.1.p1 GENE.EC097407.1~~EC097407.1.p1  ORF type:complete len:164 (-),score=0.05 EC097407.1:193-684(-)